MKFKTYLQNNDTLCHNIWSRNMMAHSSRWEWP